MARLGSLNVLFCFFPVQATRRPTDSPPDTFEASVLSIIGRIMKGVGAQWGIYIKCLETDEEIAINPNETMDTMRLIWQADFYSETFAYGISGCSTFGSIHGTH